MLKQTLLNSGNHLVDSIHKQSVDCKNADLIPRGVNGF